MEAGHNMIYIDYVIHHVRNEFYKMVSFITGLKARVFSQRIRNSQVFCFIFAFFLEYSTVLSHKTEMNLHNFTNFLIFDDSVFYDYFYYNKK